MTNSERLRGVARVKAQRTKRCPDSIGALENRRHSEPLQSVRPASARRGRVRSSLDAARNMIENENRLVI